MRRTASSLVLLACLAGLVQAAPLANREFNDLKKEAQRAAAAGSWSDLASKLRELGRDDSERAIEFIAELAVRVPDMDVYQAATRAIAGMSSEEAIAAVVEMAEKDRNPMVKILLVDAAGAREDDRLDGALAAALGDRTEEVLRAAVGVAKKKKSPKAVDALIEIVGRLEDGRDADGLLITQVREALLEITGQQFAKAADWRNYWAVAKANFQPRVRTGGPAPDLHGTSERQRPTFFGSEIRSNRLCFVIDTSGSMEAADPIGPSGDPTPGGSRVRMERAKQQLCAVIDMLPEDCRFTIVSYSGILFQGGSGITLPPGTPEDGALPPTLGGFEWLKIFKPRILPATSRTKAEAKEWVSKLQANGSTFTFNALKAAFEVEGIDTIVLLSDGVPTEIDRKAGSELSTEQILEEIGTLNRFRRLRIDTFGFDAGSDAVPAGHGGSRPGRAGPAPGGLGQFMQDLAAQNGGAYTQIQ
jgi:hypothetical protein